MPPAPYARVKQFLKDGLAAGRWPPGGRMPSEAELVAQFGVSRMTVGRALNELQAEGLIDRVQGSGSFAARRHRIGQRLDLADVREEIVARGGRHEAVVHLQRAERAPAALAAQLGLPTGGRVFHTLIVHHEDGVPLQCEDRYVHPAACPGYLEHDFRALTPMQVLHESAGLWRAQVAVEAARATAEEARLLGIRLRDPCLVVTRRSFGRDAPVTIARLVHPGERFRLQADVEP